MFALWRNKMFKKFFQWFKSKPKPSNLWHFPLNTEELTKAIEKQAPKPIKRKKTMPLVKSAKPAAFKKNIATSVKEGKPVKQAVAISYAVKKEATKAKSKKK